MEVMAVAHLIPVLSPSGLIDDGAVVGHEKAGKVLLRERGRGCKLREDEREQS